ncbi:Tigger transposable element-derived protein 4 [Trichinella spiralis]|uniref:Tigger transposable element-derived protein 4 n=1 Tax=Trichinella spiralis TaxID=6334 RepID=A0A0V1BTZ8_TRISP|nr:Tigger transposable element-derived protein 4 [Trichinella spiralis]
MELQALVHEVANNACQNSCDLPEVVENDINSYPTFLLIQALLGVCNFFCNTLLFITVLLKKKRNRMDRFLGGYAIGSSLLGLGYCTEYVKPLIIGDSKRMVYPITCILTSPNVILYALGDNLTSLSILLMSINSFVAITFTNVSLNARRCLDRAVALYVLFTVVDATWCWISALTKSDHEISIMCDYLECVSEAYVIYHLFCVSFLGTISIMIYVFALSMLMRRKSNCSGIRAIQIRREATVMKQVLFIVLVTFLFLNLPNLLELLSMLHSLNDLISDNFWIIQHIGFSFAAVYRISSDSGLREPDGICDKRDVLEKLRTGKMSMREVASEYGIALSTVSNIRKNEAQILSQFDGSSSKSRRRRMRKTVNAEVNELMFQFFVRCRAKLIPITGQLLQTKAIDIARRMGINDFHASNGWLESFTRRHNVKFRTISGEAAAVEPSVIDEPSANVHECTEGIADEIVEELLSKSTAKEVLSEEVDEKLTYSEAITMIRKLQRYSFQEHPDIAPTLLQIESKLEIRPDWQNHMVNNLLVPHGVQIQNSFAKSVLLKLAKIKEENEHHRSNFNGFTLYEGYRLSGCKQLPQFDPFITDESCSEQCSADDHCSAFVFNHKEENCQLFNLERRSTSLCKRVANQSWSLYEKQRNNNGRCMQFTVTRQSALENCGLGLALGDEIKLAFHDCKNYCIGANWCQAFEYSNDSHCVGYQQKAEKMKNDACVRIHNPSTDLYEKICE